MTETELRDMIDLQIFGELSSHDLIYVVLSPVLYSLLHILFKLKV